MTHPSLARQARFVLSLALLLTAGTEAKAAKRRQNQHTAASRAAASAAASTVRVGLTNPSNACYINATLQCMLANPSHRYHLARLKRAVIPAAKESEWLASFCTVTDACLDPANQGKTVSTNEFARITDKVLTGRKHRRHSYAIDQQDAGEFYTRLVDNLCDLNEIDEDSFDMPKVATTEFLTCIPGKHRRGRPSVTHPIDIPMLKARANLSTSQLLAKQSAKETQSVDCEKCGARVPTLKHTEYYPDTFLVLNLGRRDYNATAGEVKIHTPVRIEKKLVVDDTAYDLTGVVFHSGTAHKAKKTGLGWVCGHYTALCRVITSDARGGFGLTNAWIYCNDEKISDGLKRFPSLGNPDNAFLDNHEDLDACLLFYQRTA